MDLKIGLSKKNNGITLIALVITIIVLLILAGVSISALNGQNGILTKAEEAKTKTELAKIEEAKQLTQIEAAMNTNGTTFIGTLDGQEKTVKIPSGFAVSQIEGENTIDDGLVIIDSEGNEFVWIPCTEEEYKSIDPTWASGSYTGTDDKGWTDTQSTTTGKESVINNEGFYIARYEAGIPESATGIYANTDGAVYTKNEKKNETLIIKNYKPVSKQNVQAWNFISQTNSKVIAENMVTNSTAKSYLLDSYAWNAICRIIAKRETNKSITNSTTWGNYYNNTTTAYDKLNTLFAVHTYTTSWTYATTYRKGPVTGAPKNGTVSTTNKLELATGASEDFKAYNVYDIAGNMWEWTTETSTSPIGFAVRRGGSFHYSGNGSPAVYSYGINATSNYDIGIGFRIVLYL